MGRIEEALRKAKAHKRGHADSSDLEEVSRNSLRQELLDRETSSWSTESGVLADHIVQFDSEKLQEQRVIAASDQDDRVGPYRQLRTQILKSMQDNRWTTLAITSPTEGAGKTLTAANLAISLSQVANTAVLLVDLDLETPSIHQKLNLHPDKGLVDFLEGNASLDEIIFDPGIESLTVLAGRSAGRHSSELLASPKMKKLMKDLCHRHEGNITIFDLPPLLRNDDAILFTPYADATLVVVEDGVTTGDQLEQSISLLKKANFIGTILNKAQF